MIAVPMLGGALLRLVLGVLTDHIGARRTGILGLVLTLVPLLLGWLWVDSFATVLLVGLLLGVAGASFAAALPLASRWYPPQYQGGWHAAFGIVLVPVLATLALVAFLAEDSPPHRAPKVLADYAAVLRIADTGWLC